MKYAGAFGMNDSSESDSMGESTADMMEAMMRYMPVRGLLSLAAERSPLRNARHLWKS